MTELMVLMAPMIAAGACVLLLLVLLYSAVYDANQERKSRKTKKSKPARVTILATIGDDIREVESFYAAVKHWRSKSFDVVLIRRGKNSVPKNALTQFSSRARFATYVYSPRKARSYTDTVRTAYEKSRKGDVVVVADIKDILVPNELRLIAATQLREDVFRIQQCSNSAGISGVLLDIRSAMRRVFRRLQLTSREKYIVPSEIYYGAAATLFGRTDKVRIKDDWRIRHADATGHNDRISFGKNSRAIAAGIIALLYLYVVSAAALQGYGVEVFTITWVLLIVFGLMLVAFDMFLGAKQKVATILCAGFMPILLIVAIFVKKA